MSKTIAIDIQGIALIVLTRVVCSLVVVALWWFVEFSPHGNNLCCLFDPAGGQVALGEFMHHGCKTVRLAVKSYNQIMAALFGVIGAMLASHLRIV